VLPRLLVFLNQIRPKAVALRGIRSIVLWVAGVLVWVVARRATPDFFLQCTNPRFTIPAAHGIRPPATASLPSPFNVEADETSLRRLWPPTFPQESLKSSASPNVAGRTIRRHSGRAHCVLFYRTTSPDVRNNSVLLESILVIPVPPTSSLHRDWTSFF